MINEKKCSGQKYKKKTKKTLMKPMTEEIWKAIDILVNFSMFTESSELEQQL